MGFDIVDKINYSDLDIVREIYKNYRTRVFLINDGTLFKMFDLRYLINLLDNEYDVEDKVLNAGKFVNNSSIIVPNCAVYDDGFFIGYTMPMVFGKSIYDIDYTDIFYNNLEDIIKCSYNVVFPDLLTNGNILVDDSDIHLIDFDGLQISDFTSPVICSSLGNKRYYKNTKYMNGNLFTKELDIKSLYYLFFDFRFDIGLWNLDNGLSYGECYSKLEDIFSSHNIYSNELFEKVLRLYSDEANVYLGDTINSINSDYEIDYEIYHYSGVKKLVRK